MCIKCEYPKNNDVNKIVSSAMHNILAILPEENILFDSFFIDVKEETISPLFYLVPEDLLPVVKMVVECPKEVREVFINGLVPRMEPYCLTVPIVDGATSIQDLAESSNMDFSTVSSGEDLDALLPKYPNNRYSISAILHQLTQTQP